MWLAAEPDNNVMQILTPTTGMGTYSVRFMANAAKAPQKSVCTGRYALVLEIRCFLPVGKS